MLWVVFAALIPLVVVAAWQVSTAISDSRELVAMRMRANAWSIAESERDPFIIARHSLSMLSEQAVLRSMRSGCNELLDDAMRDANGIVNFLRADAQGRARCSALSFTPGLDLSSNRWWLARRGRTTLYLAPPEIGPISGRPILVMVQPLFKADGSFDGTVSAGVSVEALEKSLRNKARGRNAIFVTDGRGSPVISTGKATFGRFDNVLQALEHPQQARAADGRSWTFVSAPLFGDDLHILYAEPATATLQAALKRIWPSLLLPLLALALTSAAIWIATQRLILHWLDRLRLLTARFAQGDFRGELSEYQSAPAELAAFASDLHAMAHDIDEQERDLREAIAAKTAMTREVNHRVKNNLQIVNSLLTLQADRITDTNARLALAQAKSRIAALSLIHRLLYDDDTGAEPGRVNMNRLISGLCRQLRSTYRDRTEIDLDCDAADISLRADQAVPVTLFTVEAVTNAFQHGFEADGKGKIDVDFRADGSVAEMRVADTGRGFVEADTGSHMGLDLMRGFAEQVGGSLDINSMPGGTVISIKFPT